MAVILTISYYDNSTRQKYVTEWPGYLNAQALLEVVHNQHYDTDNPLNFGLTFYGTAYAGPYFYGYLVEMINGTSEGSSGTAYWHFLVNDKAADKGIDETYISDGDSVEFEFAPYDPARHGTTGPSAAKAKLRAARTA